MTRAEFFKHFDLLADQPDAVAKMRRMILDLAIRGKLVVQQPSDEPADKLLTRIHAEKTRLAENGEIKKQEILAPVSKDSVAFALPSGWAVTQLGDVSVCLDYMREPINSTERDMRNSGKNACALFPYYGATQQQGWIDDYIFDEELVLLGEDGVPFFELLRPKAYLIAGKSWVNNHAHVFRGVMISNAYLVHWLNTFDYTGRVAGSTRSKLNQANAVDIPIALPPLAEQRRIVAKVDELMALCNELDQRQHARHDARARVTESAFHHLTRAKDQPEFDRHFNFILQHSSFVFDDIPQLRQAIIDFAYQGKLTDRKTDDGLAKMLLLGIADKLSATSKKTKHEAVSAESLTCEGLYPVPSNWSWTRLHILCEQIGDIDHKMPKAVSLGVPFLSAKDLKDDGTLDFSDPKLISEEDYRRLSRKIKPRRHDIVYSRIGARLGKARLVEVDTRFLISYSCCLIRPRHEFVDKAFLQHFLDSHLALDQAQMGTQSIGVPDLGLGEIKDYRVPLPPLAEQKRIVSRVGELMRHCDALEAQLQKTRTLGTHLLDSTIHHLLAI